jgi:hypothetical protein
MSFVAWRMWLIFEFGMHKSLHLEIRFKKCVFCWFEQLMYKKIHIVVQNEKWGCVETCIDIFFISQNNV